MKKYSEMTDFEINLAVAKRFPLIVNENQSASLKAKSSSVLVNDIVNSYEFNPCNNPADAWSIINCLISKGSLCFGEGYCTLIPNPLSYPSQGFRDNNPLRAAMIVFLMTQDELDKQS